jgi:PKD repeat protein
MKLNFVISKGFWSSLLVIWGIFSLNSCSKDPIGGADPVADFTFSPSSGYKPLKVTFTNLSENADSYSWDFGNGNVSNDQNPTNIYYNDGIYSVTLTAKSGSKTNKITKTITVKLPPKSVSIVSVKVKNFPETDANGENWDGSFQGSFPDVYFSIFDGKDDEVYSFPVDQRFENLRRSDLPVSFTTSATAGFYTFDNINQGFSIVLYDYESLSSDQFMGGVLSNTTFLERIASGNLPPTVNLSYGQYDFEVGLKWNF